MNETRKLIFLVEEHPVLNEIFRRLLEEEGYQVRTSASGLEGLEAIYHNPDEIDLLMTDVRLSGTDGCYLAEALKSRNPKSRAVLITDAPDVKVQYSGLPVLTTPFQTRALMQTVSEQLA